MNWLKRGALFGAGMIFVVLLRDPEFIRKLGLGLDWWTDMLQDLDDDAHERMAKAIAKELRPE